MAKFKSIRKKLLELIYDYETKNWSRDSKISEQKIGENDIAEVIAEKERIFVAKRKELIRVKLKEINLKQLDLGQMLGHRSVTHMSELMNGVRAFTLRDLVIISTVLKINLIDLIPTFIYPKEQEKIKSILEKSDNFELKSELEDNFDLVVA